MYLFAIFLLLFIICLVIFIKANRNDNDLLVFAILLPGVTIMLALIASTIFVITAHTDSAIREYDRTKATVERMTESDVYKSPAISKQVDEVNKSVQKAKWASRYWVLSGTYNEELSKRDYLFIDNNDVNRSFEKDK
ncbi:hypothetical protein [Listeria seeligeri]|uniref:hypothetical protein n=2 Tax=Listeria seeligeri TaxID=1640 RepID=UPI00185743C5|nr:hypothetical protein [Listeria seeligeri]MBC2071772.1 hypothetical protein [Listeria seeligeri]